MRKVTKSLVSLLILLGAMFLFTRAGQAGPTKTSFENKKPDTLVLRHQRDLKKSDGIAWSWQSDWESGRNHGSHYSHSSHVSHYSHYSSRY